MNINSLDAEHPRINILSSLFISMYNEESASLILRTGDLPLNGSNNIGSSDLHLTNFTWNNINLRTLLGDMYDKYDKFNLVPVLFASAHGTTTFGALDDDRIFQVYISGLPFTNNIYNTSLKTNTNVATAGYFKYVRSQSVVYYNNPALTFTKNQELVNINIYYQRINPGAISSNAVFPNAIFMFKIYGITKTDKVVDLNSSRMFEK